MTPYEQFQVRLATLEATMLSDVPTLKTLHTQIRKQLETYPEIVTLITEEEIGKIVNSISIASGEILGKEEKKKTGKKAANKIGFDDL